MTFQMKPTYQKVLLTLRDGTPKDHNLICIDCGLDDDECTGAISRLRRVRALERTGDNRYRITEKGVALLQSPPLVVLERRR
jgi:hypothetical protein